jgi:hypothetical protein
VQNNFLQLNLLKNPCKSKIILRNMTLQSTMCSISIAQPVRYTQLMKQDNTVCPRFPIPYENVFLSVALFGILFFYRCLSRLFCIVVCVCNRHCVVLIPARTLTRTACSSSMSLSFFPHKKRRRKKRRRSSATYNGSTIARK